MIYLDNAATTFPKPETVRRANMSAFSYAANPGRSGHRMSLKASEVVYNCRSKLCELFGVTNPEKIILTSSCTASLNTVIKGTLKRGDHVVISSLEHNSVVRPLEKLREKGIITYTVAEVFEGDDDKTLDSFRSAICDKTRLAVVTHASNVFGIKLPISRITALCHYYGVLVCIDAAQTAGVADIDVKDIGADYICAPGHKGLYGPMGTGVLIINSDVLPDSLVEGGTGSSSLNMLQPDILPDKFESGTLNLNGIAGLSAGVDFVLGKGTNSIYKKEMGLVSELYTMLSKIDSVILYTKKPHMSSHVPLISFNIKDVSSEDVARLLDRKFGIAVRAGLHCSPLAHKYHSTDKTGTVRICPSVFTQHSDIHAFYRAINYLCSSKK